MEKFGLIFGAISIIFLLIFAALITNFDFCKIKVYRKFKGGTWYKYEMSGELSGCYGTFWSQNIDNSRFVVLIKTEKF